MMMPAAIDMLPSPAEREDMREGGWLKLEADVRGVQLLRLSDSRHVLLQLSNTRWGLCCATQPIMKAMLFEKALNDLFEQPFGPYLEETILSDKCKFMASKRLLLRDFQLSYNDEPTG
jgi:hypothetical protein